MKNKTKAKITTILTGILSIVLAIQGIAWNSLIDEKTGTVKGFGLVAEASEKAGDWVHFYNDDLQNDGDKDNDFNFGPNPWSKSKTAADYKAEFVERCKWDTALLAAAASWFDATFGTRFLGDFHKSDEYSWKKAINEAKEKFAKSQEPYYKTLDYFFEFVEDCDVSIRDCDGVTDQMYMNPYTPKSGMQMPDVIVKKTHDHGGHELVFSRKIKGEEFEVALRIECGFQPTNVAEIMKITPEGGDDISTPDKPSNPGTTPEKPNNPSTTPDKPSNPGTTPDKDKDDEAKPDKDKEDEPDPDKEKDDGEPDPEQGGKKPDEAPDENTEPNDDSGPGEDTNSGGNNSTADQPSNSDHYESYDDYRDDMDDLADTNATQQTPQNNPNNNPSTPPPSSDTTVDNNGNNGTGNGGIDKPTETSAPATEADTGKPIDNTATDSIEEPK